MKRFYYLAAALLVLAGAAGCKKNADVQEPELQPSGKTRTVTIKAGQGATKTSVSGGTLTWTAGDKLNIVPTSGTIGAVALDISSGVGGATGTFTGDIDDAIKDDTQLYGWCGGSWTYNSGSFSIDMPATQTYKYNGLAENAYPSIGSGSIQNGITLSNPFGVLKLVVKGATTDLVKSITVTSTANNLAGSFTVVPGGSVSGGDSKTITLNVESPYVALSSEGKTFYVVVPAGSYAANDLTVTVTKSDDVSFAESKLDATEITAGKASAAVAYYGKCKESEYAQVTIGEQTWMAENYACKKYDTDAIAIMEQEDDWSEYTDANGNIVIPTSNTAVSTPYYLDYTDKTNWTLTQRSGKLTDAQVAKFGYLYSWAAAVGVADGPSQKEAFEGNRQGICPNGWHVPTKEDFEELRDYVEGIKGTGTAGSHLKTTSGWYSNSDNGMDSYGFSILPAGSIGGSVPTIGVLGFFWEARGTKSFAQNCGGTSGNSLNFGSSPMQYGRSVRCVKN